MPIFLAALMGGLINIAGTIAGRVFIALGMSVVTYQGMDVVLTFLKNQAVSNIQSLPADMVSLIAYLGVGQAISIIFSALVVRQTLEGLTSGTFKKWVLK